MPTRASPASTRAARSAAHAARKETAITASSLLRSALRSDERDELRQRFVEAARRAQIVTIVNQATSEAELGDVVTAELCEAFEAEIAFIVARPDDAPARVVGAYGLQSEEAGRLLESCILGGLGEPSRRDEG